MTDSAPYKARCPICRHQVRALLAAKGFYSIIEHYTVTGPAPGGDKYDSITLRCSGSGQIFTRDALL